MRKLIAAAAATVLAALPMGASAQANGSWTFSYDVATATAMATLRDSDGDLAATVSCRAPNGELVFTDYDLGGRGTRDATIRSGSYSMQWRGRFDRVNGERALIISMPQSPPVLAAIRPNTPISVQVGGDTHSWGSNGSERIWQVAYMCWPQVAS